MNILPQSKYLIGIDLGTSSAKTTIIDQNGQIITWAGEEYGISSPQTDWAEQDPEIWLSAVLHTIRSAINKGGVDPHQIVGIGLAGQMHGLVCVDGKGQLLRPAIIWADRRSKDQLQQLENHIGHDNLAAWLGNPLATGFMLPSWLWLVQNEPGVAVSTRHLLLPKDYLRYRLTGTIGSEPSDASSTLLFDPHKRNWCLPLLQEIRLSPDYLPPIYKSAEIAGGLLPEIAQTCGLLSGTPVVFGGSDVSLQALGHGIIEPGMVSCTIGTGGQLFAPISKPIHDPQLRLHLFCHVVPERWHLEAAILSAGLALRWLRDQFWSDQSYGSLADAAQGVEAAAQGVFFLPYLVGERTPVMDPNIRAAFIGLSLEHGRAHIIRAVMEGAVFALRQGLDLMLSLGVSIDQLVSTGGANNHPLWLQLQADIFNTPITPSTTAQTTGCGAALLAGIGTGVFENYQQIPHQGMHNSSNIVLPRPGHVEQYAQAYKTYCEIYPNLRKVKP
jgi:xylulokinase